jgi:hypothetical protein
MEANSKTFVPTQVWLLSSNESSNESNIDLTIIDNDLSNEPEYSDEVIRKKYTGIINF